MKDLSMPKVENIEISKLTLFSDNPRTILDEDFKKLCESISNDKEFFNQRPCLVNLIKGKKIIFAGEQRYKAAQFLGWLTVPCIVTEMSEELMRERNLKDNHHAGQWDKELLSKWDKTQLDKVGISQFLEQTKIATEKINEQIATVTDHLKNIIEEKEIDDFIDIDEEEENAPDPEIIENNNQTDQKSRNSDEYQPFDMLLPVDTYQMWASSIKKIKDKYHLDTTPQAILQICDLIKDLI